jgi:hypothetical protein
MTDPQDSGIEALLAAETATRARPGPGCPVGVVLDMAPEADRVALQRGLDRPASEVTATDLQRVIRKWLRLRGSALRVGDQAVGKHRKGTCSCG